MAILCYIVSCICVLEATSLLALAAIICLSMHTSNSTRTLLVALSLACLEMSFVVKGAGAVILLFRLEYKTSAICHNVNTQKVKIARRDRPHKSV